MNQSPSQPAPQRQDTEQNLAADLENLTRSYYEAVYNYNKLASNDVGLYTENFEIISKNYRKFLGKLLNILFSNISSFKTEEMTVEDYVLKGSFKFTYTLSNGSRFVIYRAKEKEDSDRGAAIRYGCEYESKSLASINSKGKNFFATSALMGQEYSVYYDTNEQNDLEKPTEEEKLLITFAEMLYLGLPKK